MYTLFFNYVAILIDFLFKQEKNTQLICLLEVLILENFRPITYHTYWDQYRVIYHLKNLRNPQKPPANIFGLFWEGGGGVQGKWMVGMPNFFLETLLCCLMFDVSDCSVDTHAKILLYSHG